jgi:transcriptional regulator with XRE-family HTH domain
VPGSRHIYGNLRAEMVRKGLTFQNLAETLDVRHGTISDKMNGKSEFWYSEAVKIRDTHFPECSLEYLFARTCEKSA